MKKRLGIIITALIVGLLAVLILWLQLNKPAVGNIRSNTASSQTPKAATWTKLDSHLFSLEYLNDYVAKQPNQTRDSNNYFFVEDGLITKHLAVAVADMRGHGLAEEPAYQMRQLAPETYKLDLRTISGQKIPVMERLDHTEQVAFIVKGNLLGTIALTTGNPSDPPVAELNHMIASWIWK